MNVDDLFNRLDQVIQENKYLPLISEATGSKKITKLINEYFNKDQLNLLGKKDNLPVLRKLPDKNAVLAIGTASDAILGNENCDMQVFFMLNDEDSSIDFGMIIKLSSSWSIENSFSTLKDDPVFSQLSVKEVTFILTSSTKQLTWIDLQSQQHNYQNPVIGLNLQIKGDYNCHFSPLVDLIGTFDDLIFQGPIIDCHKPVLHLDAITDKKLNIAGCNFSEIGLAIQVNEMSTFSSDENELEIELNDNPDYHYIFSEAILHGHLGSQHPIEISTSIPMIGDSLFLTAEFGQNGEPKPNLHDLVEFIPVEDLSLTLPDLFKHIMEHFEIGQISFTFGLKSLSIKNISVNVDYSGQIPLIPSSDFINISNLGVGWFIQNPFDHPRIFINLSGDLQLFHSLIGFNAEMPHFKIFGGQKVDSPSLNFKEILEYFSLHAEGLPDVDITDLTFYASPEEHEYDLSFIDNLSWNFGLGSNALELNGFEFSLNNTDSTISGSIQTDLHIGDVPIQLVAKYLEKEVGWQFTGKTERDQQISIGKLIDFLASKFNIQIPEFILKMNLENIVVEFGTNNKEFRFGCEGKFPIADSEVDLIINLSLHKEDNNSYKLDLNGHVTVGSVIFIIDFDKTGESNCFIATYQNEKDEKIHIKSLIDHLSPEIANCIPESLEIELKDSFFMVDHSEEKSSFIFGLDINADVNLLDLPIVGKEIPSSEKIGIDNLQILAISKDLSETEVSKLNQLFSPTMSSLPICEMHKGANLTVTMEFGSKKEYFTLQLGGEKNAQNINLPIVSNVQTDSEAGFSKWFPIDQSFGPITFEKIGLQYRKALFWFLLNASFSNGGLTISLDGLSIGSSLSEFDPHFHLEGLGIDYQNGPVEIGGGFLDMHPKPPLNFEYGGDVVVKNKSLNLSAIGSYADSNGNPSLFIFLNIDKAFGGPPYFFVTGLSGGFGFNQKLRIPAQNEVMNFPLVKDATEPGTCGKTPLEVLEVLEGQSGTTPWISHKIGEKWLALGLKFMSFGLIHSNVLVIAEFGHEFELALLGLSTTRFPQEGSKQYAYLEMQLEAVFIPDQGVFSTTALLTPNSFVIDPACHLTGGFAMYAWFAGSEHEGDFVITAGGYHPNFKKPSWYPQVPRLGFNWALSGKVSINGDAYFALTPSCIMAGGGLKVLFHDGKLRAWFTAYADFLINWKPFHFTARVGVDVGVSYRVHFLFVKKTLKVELGASLDLWGPPTGGKVHVHWSVISFTIHFGASKTNHQKSLHWEEFEKLLPKSEDACKIVVNNGLQKQHDSKWFVRADEFKFSTESAIPSTKIKIGASNECLFTANGEKLNIRPMGKENLDSTHTVKLSMVGDGEIDLAKNGWTVLERRRNVSEALWGKPIPSGKTPKPSAETVPDRLVGISVTAPDSKVGDTPGIININESLEYVTLTDKGIIPFAPDSVIEGVVPVEGPNTIQVIEETIMSDQVLAKRDQLFAVLKEMDLDPGMNDSLEQTAKSAGFLFTDQPMMVS